MSLALLASLLASPGSAWASHPDLYGLGAESIAHAGAGVADLSSMGAVFTNPAGIAFAERSSLSLGLNYTASALSANGQTHALPDPVGVTAGAVIRFGGGSWIARSVTLGLGAYVLPNTLAHLTTGYPDEPVFAYYEGRTERLALLPAIALRPHPRVSLGVALNLFAGLSGPASATDGPARAVELTLSQQVRARAALILGVRLAATDHWSFGITWRQRFSVPYATDTHNRVGGVPLDISVAAEGLATPDELVFGARWRGPRLGLMADVGYARWSAWSGPAVQVRARISGLELTPLSPAPNATDAFSMRVAGDWRHRAMTFRGGLGVETAIVGEQSGRTNLIDSTRLIVGLGAAYALPPAWGVRTQLVLGAQMHYLAPTTLTKRIGSPDEAARDPRVLADEDASVMGVQTRNPGYPSITGSGAVFALSLAWEVTL